MKQFGTNGGGFYGMNSAHPVRESDRIHQFSGMRRDDAVPDSLVLMYGRMLGRIAPGVGDFFGDDGVDGRDDCLGDLLRHLQPNPGLTAHPDSRTFEIPSARRAGRQAYFTMPAVAGLPVDQHLGNLEGKEMRFGTSAGATFAAMTVNVTDGAVNCEHDSLNPIAALAPCAGMWVNCIYGGKGVGMINLLLFLVLGVFVAGQMVGSTPEYLGKKIGAREMKLAMIALLIHPIMILGPPACSPRHTGA